MNYSGMVEIMSSFFVSISNETTFPIFTFFSAGIVNVFVPSGGGQWAVQGPIIVDSLTIRCEYTKKRHGISLWRSINKYVTTFLGITASWNNRT